MTVRMESVIVSGLSGLVVGDFLSSELQSVPIAWAVPLFLAAVGLVGGATSVCLRNAGVIMGITYGLVSWEVAFANYFEFHWGIGLIAWYLGGLLAGLAGASIPFMLKLRSDALQMATIALFSMGAHVVARLWLEDSPTAIGLVALVVGAAVARYVCRAGWVRRSTRFALGAVVGLAATWSLLLPVLAEKSLLWRVNVLTPQVVLAVMGALSAVLGGMLLRSGQDPPERARITPDN